MYIEDDAGNIIEVRTGAFIPLPDKDKNKDKNKDVPRVRVCDLPSLAQVQDLRLDLG